MYVFAESPMIVSIVPNFPQVSGSPFNYMVPENFRDTVVTCNVLGLPSPTVEWLAPSSVASTSHRSVSSAFVSTALQFTNGFMSDHSGIYDCIVNNSNQSASITLVQGENPEAIPTLAPTQCQVTSSTISFLLRVLTTNCTMQDESQRQQIASDFQNVLISGITSRCETCVVDRSKVAITQGPDCSELVDGATILEGVIRNERVADTEEMFCALRAWWRLQPLVRLDDNLWPTDINCLMQVDSSDQMECPVQLANGGNQLISNTVVIGISGGVVLLIFLAVFVSINVIMIYILPKV